MKNQKSIETPQLLIKGNLLTWEGTMLQLSNVSSISASNLREEKFPILSILLIFMSLFCLAKSPLLGILLLGIGSGWLWQWGITNESRKSKAYLDITMNSGDQLSFLFDNRDFLFKVLHVLEEIIIEGGTGAQNISIDMHGCNISDNAHIFTDSKIGGNSL